MENSRYLFILRFFVFDDYYNLPLDEMGCFMKGKQIECKMLDNQPSHQTLQAVCMRRHSCTCSSQQNSTPPPLLNTQIILPPTLFILRSYVSDAPFLLSLSNNIIHSGAHFLDSLLGIFGAKDGSTSDKDVGACTQ